MRIHPSYLALFGALALVGCPGDPTCPAGTRLVAGTCVIVIDVDGGVSDTGPTDDVPRDTPPRADVPPGVCGSIGIIGGHCRTGGTCNASTCQNELLVMGAPITLRNGFGIGQGMGPADANGFYTEIADAASVPADDVPAPIATGSLCTQRCDVSAEEDPCGLCSTCDQSIGTTGLLATYFLEADPPFGDNTGWCRADCTFDPATAGATCPTATGSMMDAHTCAPGSNTCVEGCINDNECRFELVETREGTFVSTIDRSAGAPTCSPVTHRCEWTHASTESVGDTCERNSDCTEDVGLCLRGGTCGEYQCATDPTTVADPDGGGVCDNGAGICIGNGGNAGSICIQGCVTTADCNPLSVCIPLEGVPGDGLIGTYSGYCLGICDTRLDDADGTGPLTATDDRIFMCRSGEQCDYPDQTADDLDPTGSCRIPCTTTADCTGDEGNFCEIVPGSGSPGYGFCRWTDQVCNYLDLSDDCFNGQVCDLLALPENIGLCVDACTDATGSNPCPTAGDVCVPGTAAAPRNVCRTPCTAGGPACGTGETCLMGFCEQLTAT